jgi:hypothetical protein
MATELNVLSLSKAIASTMAAKQFYAVKLNSSDQWVVCSSAGERAVGIMQEDPVTGNASAMIYGLSKAVIGASVSKFDPLTVDSSGRLVKANDTDEYVLGVAWSSSSTAGDIISVLLTHSGSIPVNASQETYTAHANYSSTGQYRAVKAHTDDGEVILCAAAGESILGILQNAPALGAEAEVCTYGECTATAGDTVTAGDLLAIDSAGKVIPATGTAQVIGRAIADIVTSASGTIFVAPIGMYSVDGATLAATKFWVGNGSNVAAAVFMSGMATLANDGAVTVSNVATTASGDAAGDLIYRDAATTFERLAKGTAAQILAMNGAATAPEWIAQSAVTAGNVVTTSAGDAAGDLIYRDAAATLERLAKGTAGQILQMNVGATAPQWSTVSGDGTIAVGGALTLAKNQIRTKVVDIAAADVKTLNTTPVVLLDFSAMLAAGEVAAGDALIFRGAVLDIYGGAASYDQNENATIVYQTAGGGETVSLTLANFFNGGAAGKLSTLKPIATDAVPDADEDLVLKCSASPFNAAGSRLCRVEISYSVFTPHV